MREPQTQPKDVRSRRSSVPGGILIALAVLVITTVTISWQLLSPPEQVGPIVQRPADTDSAIVTADDADKPAPAVEESSSAASKTAAPDPGPALGLLSEGSLQKLPTEQGGDFEDGGARGTPAPNLTFDGVLAVPGDRIPPDTHMAVGPGVGAAGRIVAVTNGSVEIFDKTGATVAGPTSLLTLFPPNGFDPKVLFDQHSGRFYIVCLNMTWTGMVCQSALVSSAIQIAVSNNNTPNNLAGDWTFLTGNGMLTMPASGVVTWADYPGIGADANGLFITTNQFDTNCTFAGTNIRVFNKASLMAGVYGFVDVTFDVTTTNNIFTAQPAHVYGATDNGGFYLIARGNATTYRIFNITGHPAAPVATTATFPWTAGAFPVADQTADQCAAVPPNNPDLDTVSSRLQNAVYRNDAGGNGHIYTCMTSDPDNDGQTEVNWQDINTNSFPGGGSTVNDSGTIQGTGLNNWTFMPSINVNPNSNLAICFTQSSSTKCPDMSYAMRFAGDAPGTFRPPVVVVTSTGPYQPSANQSFQRWGDYSACVVDPDDGCFWVDHEYTFAAPAGTSLWRTRIANFCSAPPLGACCNGSNACADLDEMACNALGWTWRGAGTMCPTQNTRTANHQGQQVVHWSDPAIDCLTITRSAGRGIGQPCQIPDNFITIEIQTDADPHENFWELTEIGVGPIAAGGPYPTPFTLFSEDIPVCSSSCYSLTIFDAGGNGFQGGGYQVLYGGQPVAAGDVFTNEVTISDIGDGCQPTGGPCQDGPLIDPWVTLGEPGEETCHLFGTPESPPIPAGFFGPGSEPFEGQVCLLGKPLEDTPFGQYNLADTLILRSNDPFDRCEVPPPGDERVVQIEIVALSLQSTKPIQVIINAAPTFWDVFVDLSQLPQPPGFLTARKEHCNGGTYDSFLPVQPRFTFTNVADPTDVRVLDTGLDGILPANLLVDPVENHPWVLEADPNLNFDSPWCTNFHPSVEDPNPTLDCDCNSNGMKDSCEIEQFVAPDCNENGIPDECDPDADTDGVPDACDNCPGIFNPAQADADGDLDGDLCDICPALGLIESDQDGDRVTDALDNCPCVSNKFQEDTDGDGVGDACQAPCPAADGDMNGDGTTDALDIQGFTNVVVNGGTPDEVCHADFDGSGVADEGDVTGMIAELLAP